MERQRVLSRVASTAFVAAVLMAAGTGHDGLKAATPAGSDVAGRYTMQQTPDGTLRLDTQTGSMSLCRLKGTAWACEAVGDDRRVMQDELQRLQGENEALKKDVKRLEEIAGVPLPDGEKPGAEGSSKGPGGVQLPTEEDLDKAMTYMQRMLKKFKEKLKELENEAGKSETTPKKGTTL